MKVHFLGIGGIGVSALAQYYLAKGREVSGSDLNSSEITDYLQKLGIEIIILEKNNLDSRFRGNDKKENMVVGAMPDLVIYTPAIKDGNAQLDFFRKNNVKCQTYPEALGQLTKQYFTIAISGSHGKSTTTAMTALALIKAGLDPTVIVGTKLKEFNNSNFRMGKSKYLVIEACEYDDSFLNHEPKIIVITNIDKEHLDYFKTFKNVVKAFAGFARNLSKDGALVVNRDDKDARVIPNLIGNPGLDTITLNSRFRGNDKIKRRDDKVKILGYSLKQKEAGKIKKILKVPGVHNVSNALAVLAIARELGIDDKITFSALAEFKGTWRRFEEKIIKTRFLKSGKTGFLTVISDYGHHPTEVLATLKAAREKYPKQFIWCVFQPHQYQRTFYLLREFIKIFRQAPVDRIIITDIYDVAGREDKSIKEKINSQKLVKLINKKNIEYVLLRDIEEYIKQNVKTRDILLIMGAGDIYKKIYGS